MYCIEESICDIVGTLWRSLQWFGARGIVPPLTPVVTSLRSRGHFAKRFVNVHLHCIVSNMQRISKISRFPPWKSFCRRSCFWPEFFQISSIFPTCFVSFLAANKTNKKYLNYRNFNKPFFAIFKVSRPSFSAHAVAQPCKHIGSKAFQALQRLCGIYTILNLDCC